MERDFNHIRKWLEPKLEKMQISVEEFANAVGISRASIYNYFVDRYRPDTSSIVKMCRVLNCPVEEGMRQFTPKKRGRPTHKV